MYRRDGQSFVASFRATTEGSTIAITPFSGTAKSSFPGEKSAFPANRPSAGAGAGERPASH